MRAPRRLALVCLPLLLLFGPGTRLRPPAERAPGLWPVGLGEALAEGGSAGAPSDARALAERDEAVERRLREREGYLREEWRADFGLVRWYAVDHADAFAEFIAHERPSRFPYFASIAQLWRIHFHVVRLTWRTAPWSRQLMLAAVGASWTAGCLLHGLYENVIGRLTELTVPDRPWRPPTVEDRYVRDVAREYAAFVRTRRWYDYPFAAKLSGLWALHGPIDWTALRRAERRVAFTIELGALAAWGRLIGAASGLVHDREDSLVQAWVRRSPPADDPGIVAREAIDRTSELLFLPRYDAFTTVVASLARQGVRFVRIAGNEDIPLTVMTPTAWVDTRYRGRVIVEWPILTAPGKKRVAMTVSVERLDTVIPDLEADGVRIDQVSGF